MQIWCTFRNIIFILILISLVVLPSGNAFGSPAIPSAGVTIEVTTFDDEFNTDPAECSLREAIYAAISNGNFGGCTSPDAWDKDTIIVPGGTYLLTIIAIEDAGLGGDLDLYYSSHGAPPRSENSPSADIPDITITGDPLVRTIIEANVERVFQIQAGVSVRFENLRITGGHPYGGDPEHSGGGILNDGTLTMVDSVVMDNDTPLTGQGGGIHNRGNLTMERSGVGFNKTGDSSDATDVADGGGIYNSGILFMTDTFIYFNSTGNSVESGEAGEGAGIFNSSSGTATLIRSAVVGNQCGWRVANHGVDGGGIFNEGTLTINTSTISSNVAGPVWPDSGDYYGGSGGGIANMATGTITITDSTIAANMAGPGSGSGVSAAGGLLNSGGTVTLRNTILADNEADYDRDCIGTILSTGYNLIESVSSCSITGDLTGNITGQDPKLEPLDFFGANYNIQPLMWGSPAIDAGPATCGYVDQRQLSRPKDGNNDGTATCDIGAYEAFKWIFSPLIFKP